MFLAETEKKGEKVKAKLQFIEQELPLLLSLKVVLKFRVKPPATNAKGYDIPGASRNEIRPGVARFTFNGSGSSKGFIIGSNVVGIKLPVVGDR